MRPPDRPHEERVDEAGEEHRCLDWFLCLKDDPALP